jgi:hypothetical protein
MDSFISLNAAGIRIKWTEGLYVCLEIYINIILLRFRNAE